MIDFNDKYPWVDRHQCPVCDGSFISIINAVNDPDADGRWLETLTVSCQRCGQFILDSAMAASRPWLATDYQHTPILLSHAIQRMQSPADMPLPRITQELVERVTDQRLPAPAEQADRLLLWIGDHTPAPGDQVGVGAENLEAIVGTATNENFRFVVESLLNANLVSEPSPGLWADLTLTFAGWNRYDELKRGVSDIRAAFMAMPYGYPELDEVFRECFKPAVAKAGFALRRVDEDPVAGSIHDQMRVEILRTRFLVADLTHGNQGAYWEAGYAEGLRKPVIYTCEKRYFDDPGTHFDTNNLHTVVWDADNLPAAAAALTATVRATFPDEAILDD